MGESKSEQRRKTIQRSDKMVKPTQGVRDFNFPRHDVTIKASTASEATEKLNDSLKSK